ncbi:transcobalamin-1 isoform 2-T2 [Glossophaga mutica]
MRQSHQLPLVGLLLFSLIPSQLCAICEVSQENYSCLTILPLLNTMINSKYTRGIQAANVLLSLRLVGIQDQSLERQLTKEVKENEEKKGLDLTSEQPALVILALGACLNSDETITYVHLVSQLEKKFQEEIKNMGTGAMAVLALTCVKRSIINGQIKANEMDLKHINNYIESLVKKILHEKKENGLIGNVFSTGEAMQALSVSTNYYNQTEWDCQQTLQTVLKEISQGSFRMPTAAAQILPALFGKTYLDVNNGFSCGSGSFNIPIHEPVPVEPRSSSSWVSVNYTVKTNETYFTNVTVKNGSVFLDVMKRAQQINGTVFRFTYVESSWGPYITSVQGLEANNNDKTYWELLSEGKPLSQGVGSYVVHNGENLEVRWSTY